MKTICVWSLGLTLALGVIAGLSGCGTGSSSDDARAQQARDAKALSDLYSSAEGKWTGSLENASTGLKSIDAELIIYKVFINDGSNPDGSQRLRPALRGRFRPTSLLTETDALTLSGDYDRSGRIVMTSLGTGASGATGAQASDLFLTLEGSIGGESLSVRIARKGGVWGTFTAKRTSRDTSAPEGGDVSELRDRLYKVYSEIEGNYTGILSSANGNDRAVSLNFVIVQSRTASGDLLPTMVAYYHNADEVSEDADWNLKVDYNSLSGDVYLIGTRQGPATGEVSFSMNGKIADVAGKKTIEGVVRTSRRLLGSVKLTR